MNIEKILKENNVTMEEFKGYTKKATNMYYALNNLEKFVKNLIKEVAVDEDNSPL